MRVSGSGFSMHMTSISRCPVGSLSRSMNGAPDENKMKEIRVIKPNNFFINRATKRNKLKTAKQ